MRLASSFNGWRLLTVQRLVVTGRRLTVGKLAGLQSVTGDLVYFPRSVGGRRSLL